MQEKLEQFVFSKMNFMFRMFLLHLQATSVTLSSSKEETAISLEKLITVVTKETSAIVVYDASYDCTSSVLQMMDYSHPLLMYEYDEFYSFIRHHMKSLLENGTLTEFRRHLNFLLICKQEPIETLMKEVTELDKTIGQGSLLRHFSTWMIISHDLPPHLNITLDNVALTRVSHAHQIMDTPQRYIETNTSLSCSLREVHTHLWMPGRKEWSRIQLCDVSHDGLYTIIFPNTKRGMNGRQLRLSALELPDFIIRSNKTGSVTYTGAAIELVDIFARKFNFSYVIVEPEDRLWGQVLENGSCTGILGMLQKEEADMCAVPYVINESRTKVLDITSPMEGSEYKLLYRRQKVVPDFWGYLLPSFSWQVYLCGFASLLWSMLLFACLANRRRMKVISFRNKSLSSCLELGIHVPLRQGLLKLRESSSERIIICTWCIFCLVMTAVYAGNLVAFATVDKYNTPFTTLQELAEQDEYAVGVTEGSHAETILMNSDSPTLQLIHQKVLKSMKTSKNLAADSKKLLNEKYVLISHATLLDTIRSTTCDVVMMKERFAAAYSGYLFPQKSPLKKLFDKQVMLLGELGVYAKILKKWSPKPLDCDSSVQVPQVKLTSMKTVFVICSAGILVATVILIVEIRKKKQCL